MRLSPIMTVMHAAAQAAAKALLHDFNEVEHLQVSLKGPGDFVSQADLNAERILRDKLKRARPSYAFLMEESGAFGDDPWTWRWVVDPLDGTTNFLHGIPHWAISIGLQRQFSDGRIDLMARESVKIAVQRLDVHFFVDDALGAIDQHGDFVAMCRLNQLLDGIDDAQHIGDMGDGQQSDVAFGRLEPMFQFFDVDFTAIIDRQHFELRTLPSSCQLPGN